MHVKPGQSQFAFDRHLPPEKVLAGSVRVEPSLLDHPPGDRPKPLEPIAPLDQDALSEPARNLVEPGVSAETIGHLFRRNRRAVGGPVNVLASKEQLPERSRLFGWPLDAVKPPLREDRQQVENLDTVFLQPQVELAQPEIEQREGLTWTQRGPKPDQVRVYRLHGRNRHH